MEEEDPRPRRHDHLVEPLFGGLGVEHPPDAPREQAGWLARVWTWLTRRFARAGRGPSAGG